jgi:hypothetical protein
MVDNTYQLQCVTHHPTFWAIFASTKGAWLIFGAVLSVLTRHVAREYNESKSIAYAVSKKKRGRERGRERGEKNQLT